MKSEGNVGMSMDTSTENAKITDSGYSNSSSDNRQSQKSNNSSEFKNSNDSTGNGYCSEVPSSNEVLPQPMSERLKKEHKKNSKKTLPINTKSFSGVTELSTPLKHFFEKKTEDEQEIAEMTEFTDSTENFVSVTDDKADFGPEINLDDSSFPTIGDFFSVISMSDGLVVFTTPNLYKTLGYPKGDRDRRCFIDFVYTKDRETFFNGVSKIYPAAQKELFQGESKSKVTLFCRLQKMDNESNQLTGDQKLLISKPYNFTLYIQDFRNHMKEELLQTTFLVVNSRSVQSAYKESEEYIKSAKVFSTLHSATCHISHVDPEIVQHLGYLPQDMIGRSLFDFYHPEDLHSIKEIYETVLSNWGASFKSQPYRLIIKNGDSIVLETMFSAHINPWTKKLESVQGLHRVLKGPKNPDIFGDSNKTTIYSEEVLNQSKLIQKEILFLLQEDIQRIQPAESKNYKYLEPVILNLLNEILPPHSRMDTGVDDQIFLGHENTAPREILPDYECEGSNSSTEAVPCYNQLNFEANLDRFFNSNLVITATYGIEEENNNKSNGDEPEKNSKYSSERKCMTPNEESDLSHTADKLTNNSNNQINSETTSSESGTTNYLTESFISQHNEKMKNILVQEYKEIRLNKKNNDKQNGSRKTIENEKNVNFQTSQGQGIKRCRSETTDYVKTSKKKSSGPNTNGMILNNVENKIMNLNNASAINQNSLSAQEDSKFPSMPCYFNHLGLFQIQTSRSTKNQDKNTASLPPVSENTTHQNLNNVKESAKKIGSQQYSDISEDESSTSSFYSSFLSKSCNGTSSSDSQTSNQEFGSEFSFDHAKLKYSDSLTTSAMVLPNFFLCNKQQDDLNFRKPKSLSSGRQLIDSTDSHDSQVILWWKNRQQDAQKKGENSNRRIMRKELPWMKGVQMTNELKYLYQVEEKSLTEILQNDAKALMEMNQPSLVIEQLNQFCSESIMKFEDLETSLNLGELKDYNDTNDHYTKSQYTTVLS